MAVARRTDKLCQCTLHSWQEPHAILDARDRTQQSWPAVDLSLVNAMMLGSMIAPTAVARRTDKLCQCTLHSWQEPHAILDARDRPQQSWPAVVLSLVSAMIHAILDAGNRTQ